MYSQSGLNTSRTPESLMVGLVTLPFVVFNWESYLAINSSEITRDMLERKFPTVYLFFISLGFHIVAQLV